MTFDEHGNCTSMSKEFAKTIIRNMLKRDRDWKSPDFCMFTVPQRRALATVVDGVHLEDFDR